MGKTGYRCYAEAMTGGSRNLERIGQRNLGRWPHLLLVLQKRNIPIAAELGVDLSLAQDGGDDEMKYNTAQAACERVADRI